MAILMVLYNMELNDLELYKSEDGSYILYEEDYLHADVICSQTFPTLNHWFKEFKNRLGLDQWIYYEPKYIDANLCEFFRQKIALHPYTVDDTYRSRNAHDKNQINKWINKIHYLNLNSAKKKKPAYTYYKGLR